MTETHSSNPAPNQSDSASLRSILVRVVAVAVVLLVGFAIMFGLSTMREEAELQEVAEPVLRSQAVRLEPTTLTATLRGFGTVRPRTMVSIAPEVGGRVVEVHPRLDAGESVEAGALLFRIDPTDYRIAVEEAQAQTARMEAELERIDSEEANTRRRLAISESALELARRDQDRVAELVNRGGVESAARLDTARMATNREELGVTESRNQLELLPSMRRQMEAQLRAARSAEDRAATNLERATVRAPFAGRLEMTDVELDQIVRAGDTVVRLADDKTLEIPVDLDSREVAKWLEFEDGPTTNNWFGAPRSSGVEVRWAENPDGQAYIGRLARVEGYDPDTRTFTLIVELDGSQKRGGFPLADGMFTQVAIAGRAQEGLFAIPREAIDSRQQVLAVRDTKRVEGHYEGRVQTVPIRVARYEDGIAFVDEGLAAGDLVITSRPPKVLDGTRVDVTLGGDTGASEGDLVAAPPTDS